MSEVEVLDSALEERTLSIEDWNKEVTRRAWTQNYGISIQGGDDIAQYNLSVGYSNSKSTLKRNDMERFNVRFNTDIILNKWFYTKFDASYANVTRDLRSDGWSNNQYLQALASPGALANIKAPFLSPSRRSLTSAFDVSRMTGMWLVSG